MAVEKTAVKVGQIYEVDTFAAVKVHMKIVGVDDLAKGYFSGHLVRPRDVAALKEAGVPYKKDEPPHECIGTVYDFQILCKVRKRRKSGKKKKASTKVGSEAHPRREDAVEGSPRRNRRRVRRSKK